MDVLYFKSNSNNPYRNLAIEELLMKLMEKRPDSMLLYLWQNAPSVILGRNQNPYLECDVELMKQNGVYLVRRKSGGGAVYHDFGNLNYTVIADNVLANRERWTNILCDVVSQWGLEACGTGRNDVTVEGKKFSGTAYVKKNHIVMQHGSIMVNVNLKCMERYLHPNISKLQKRGIHSVGARVINLSVLNSAITIEGILDSLIMHFHNAYAGWKWRECCIEEWLEEKEISALEKAYCSKEFLYGNMENADLIVEVICSWAIFYLQMFLHEDVVESCEVQTDALDMELVRKLKVFIIGKSLKELKDFSLWFEFYSIEKDEKIKEFSQKLIGRLV